MSVVISSSRTAILILVLLLLSGHWSYGQYASEQGRFTVSQIRGCAPLTVEVLSENPPPGNTSNSIYVFDYNSNDERTNLNPDQDYQDTTYAIAGTYKILQVLGSAIDSVTIEVLEPRPPQFRVYTCINNSVLIERTGDYYDRLRVDFGNGIAIDMADGPIVYPYGTPGTYTLTVRGLFDDADSQFCAVGDTTITTINALTTATLDAVTVEGASSVRVNYQLPNPDVSYRLEVAEAGSNDFTLAQYNLDDPQEILVDDPALRLAEQSYCFRVVAVNRCDEALNLLSNTICSIALQGEAQDRQNQLTWQNPDFSEYQVLRDGELFTTTPNRELLDADVVCQQLYEYRVRAENASGTSTSAPLTLTAISQEVSPAPDSVVVQPAGTLLQLTWRLPPGINNYYVYRSANQQDTVLYDSVRVEDLNAAYQDPNVAVDETYCYQLTYVDGCGNESARSAPVCGTIPTRGEVHFPTAFTPNGDGRNDVFVYTGRLIDNIELRIYNRWGELLFQTTTLEEGWDGSYRGVPVPQGTYVFRADVTDQLGNQFVQEGRVVLLNP
ncbi:MAG: gliding motility-associated C-terminal domain-containing protein [Tunicatimonas sp.]